MQTDELGEDALNFHNEVFEQDPTDVGAANMIGRSLEALDRLDDARAHRELVMELQPENTIRCATRAEPSSQAAPGGNLQRRRHAG